MLKPDSTYLRRALGAYAGLTAAAALLVDYVLTVPVSISAGVAAAPPGDDLKHAEGYPFRR